MGVIARQLRVVSVLESKSLPVLWEAVQRQLHPMPKPSDGSPSPPTRKQSNHHSSSRQVHWLEPEVWS